ncbi:hypothetical protein PPTG_00549 [Phytophthora nicotianae INRA-310]|uniref:DUF659 domain-containing protein n=1 Tax=Phytophthora nicotianae (strain INRA-310) TaxID=761204 RepID=W2RHQ2_PHYN3|nr:hypothetical protein PPTG_00549 [Phytophthora nicotianae INRA-310]ETN24100.1 hypothetical protein PPTG_00549 [Phytophthora nicotianae INRA-310]
MRSVLTKYRPGMTLPTRQELATSLLDNVYAEELMEVMDILRSQGNVAIVSDGWSDPNSESVINFMIAASLIRPIFWSSTRSRDKQHMGEYMASVMATMIEEVERIAGKGSVCAVVTDNASNMRKSWELLEERLHTLTCNGCSAHTPNLLLKDMFGVGFIGDVLAKALTITKFVRKRPALLYHFRAKQRQRFGSRQRRRALVIPVSTRWYSKPNCISSVVVN